MRIDSLRRLLLRDLDTLSQEVVAYPDDESLWKVVPGISNSAGNLALHLAGNLQHFIGAHLGDSGYLRDRKAEFAPRPRSRGEVIAEIDAAKSVLGVVLDSGVEERLSEEYPLELAGRRLSVEQFLLHLSTHLAFHLGQVDYHRRILTGEKGDISVVAISRI